MILARWLLLVALVPLAAAETSRRPTVDLRDVKVGGEIGRRIGVTVDNNLLVLDADSDFLDPFRKRDRKSRYIGPGKLIDSMVRLAAHTGNQDLQERKDYVIAETLATQDRDGYIGLMPPEHRMWSLWDIHEAVYIVNGLVSDYEFFGNRQSLDAARRRIAAGPARDRHVRDPLLRPLRGAERRFAKCDVADFHISGI